MQISNIHAILSFIFMIISSCAPIKYSHDYFLDCEDKHSDFKGLSSCAFLKRSKKIVKINQIVKLRAKDS